MGISEPASIIVVVTARSVRELVAERGPHQDVRTDPKIISLDTIGLLHHLLARREAGLTAMIAGPLTMLQVR